MTLTSWDVYWITRLDNVGTIIGVGAMLFFIASIGITIVGFVEECKWKFKPMKLAVVSAIVLFLMAFIPSTKEMVAIMALPKIVNNEYVQQIPNDTAEFVHKQLQEWIKGITKDKEKTK